MNIKPCPFCGRSIYSFTSKRHYEERMNRDGYSIMNLQCNSCDTETWLFEETGPYEEALNRIIEKWNTRYES